MRLAIGKVIIDPTDANTVYVGTGDVNISGYPAVGDGLYRSTDGGDNWTNLGLAETGIISDILVNPDNPETIYASAMGIPYIRNNDRGLYRSQDNGQTWEQILFISDQAGIIDLEMKADDPNTIFAVGWDRIRNNTESIASGLGAKIYKTTDGGDNWTVLEGGLPQTEFSRIGITVSPQNPDKMYALYCDASFLFYNIFKSEDAGENWTAFDTDYIYNSGVNPLGGFGWYFGKIRVNPANDDLVYILGVDLWEVIDEGDFWQRTAPDWWTYEVHADKHDMQLLDGDSWLLATDGGLYRTNDAGYSWEDIEDIPVSDFYRIDVNPHKGLAYGGGMQDNGTSEGSFNIFNQWPRLRGGDGFQIRYHPTDPAIIYSESQNGSLRVSTNSANTWSDFTSGIDSDDRRSWDMPYLISVHNPDVLYTGTYRAYKTEQGTDPNWYTISGQLTDNVIDADRYHVITAIGESPLDSGILMMGTVDANVQITSDGGQTWDNMTNGLPERYVTSLKGSHSDASIVYCTFSGYKDNDNSPYIYRSDDLGQNWSAISGNMPNIPVNELLIWPHDDDQKLFAATDGGVFYSADGGQNWSMLAGELPMVPVYDIAFDYQNHRLAVGTFSRSIWSYDLSLIIDNEGPEITINSETLIIINEGEELILPEITAYDIVDGDLTNEIIIDDTAVNVDIAGTYEVIITVTDAAGNTSTESITVFVTVVSSVENDALKNGIKLFPNPVQNTLNFKSEQQLQSIRIYNVSGQLILTTAFNNKINCTTFEKGWYMIEFQNSEGQLYQTTFIKE